jgi:hypothetical protein
VPAFGRAAGGGLADGFSYSGCTDVGVPSPVRVTGVRARLERKAFVLDHVDEPAVVPELLAVGWCMQTSKRPPGRHSITASGVVRHSGPIQFFMCSAVAQARTRWRGVRRSDMPKGDVGASADIGRSARETFLRGKRCHLGFLGDSV